MRQLYAIAAEIPVKRKGKVVSWAAEITHVHADDVVHARYIYMQDAHHHSHRIVAVGPVVGYHVEDEHGDFLRA
jgi:hypothetical protein